MGAIGYAWVLTHSRTDDQQHDALNAAGVDKIYSGVMSGVRTDRPNVSLDPHRPHLDDL